MSEKKKTDIEKILRYEPLKEGGNYRYRLVGKYNDGSKFNVACTEENAKKQAKKLGLKIRKGSPKPSPKKSPTKKKISKTKKVSPKEENPKKKKISPKEEKPKRKATSRKTSPIKKKTSVGKKNPVKKPASPIKKKVTKKVIKRSKDEESSESESSEGLEIPAPKSVKKSKSLPKRPSESVKKSVKKTPTPKKRLPTPPRKGKTGYIEVKDGWSADDSWEVSDEEWVVPPKKKTPTPKKKTPTPKPVRKPKPLPKIPPKRVVKEDSSSEDDFIGAQYGTPGRSPYKRVAVKKDPRTPVKVGMKYTSPKNPYAITPPKMGMGKAPKTPTKYIDGRIFGKTEAGEFEIIAPKKKSPSPKKNSPSPKKKIIEDDSSSSDAEEFEDNEEPVNTGWGTWF